MPLLLSHVLPLAQSSNAGNIGFIIGIIVVVVIALAIFAAILWSISDALAAVPQQYRQMSPGAVYLMLIPLFNLVWVFFVVIRVPGSFENYFNAIGRPQPDGYGKGVGLGYAICMVLGNLIPFVGIPALICLVIFIRKLRGLKKLALEGGDPQVRGFAVLPPSSNPPPQGKW